MPWLVCKRQWTLREHSKPRKHKSPSCKQQDRCRCIQLRRRGHPALTRLAVDAECRMDQNGRHAGAPTEMSRLWQTRILRSVLSHWIVANECIIEDKRSTKTKVVWSEEGIVRRKECQQRRRCGGGLHSTHLRGCGDQRHLD